MSMPMPSQPVAPPPMIGDVRLASCVALAPMAGITDQPFRAVVAGFGAGLVVSEMVASAEMVTARPSVRAQIRAKAEIAGAGDVPVSVQLAGREAAPMGRAARIVAGMGARIIDINMGCPARKVTGGLSGSALMRDPDHALRLIEAVAEAGQAEGGVPVTLKMRLGWDHDGLNAPLIAARARDAGVAMVVIHGRTRAQFYTGQADWAAIAPTRAALPGVVLLANGDVTGPASARAAMAASGADGVMVGRGAQGRPWIVAQIGAALAGQTPPDAPQGRALADLIGAHHQAMLGFYGTDLGLRVARKHLGWYADAAGVAAADRKRLLTAPDAATAQRLIAAIFADAPGDAPGKAAA
ncbi:tRNA dihydrouridine synthase DusB [Paracoccus sp. p4-l81]|uniref:tRNA dihydrouridine synthase DusB n=1 Tax=unclassified Paracoccus (in: a-proteobacteria) TaxID=2688777 RepID=UPI0035BACE60